MTRPLIRKHRGWWRIFIGHTNFAFPDYYTSAAHANNAAQRLAAKENTWR